MRCFRNVRARERGIDGICGRWESGNPCFARDEVAMSVTVVVPGEPALDAFVLAMGYLSNRYDPGPFEDWEVEARLALDKWAGEKVGDRKRRRTSTSDRAHALRCRVAGG